MDIWCLDSGQLKAMPISGDNRLLALQRKRWEAQREDTSARVALLMLWWFQIVSMILFMIFMGWEGDTIF